MSNRLKVKFCGVEFNTPLIAASGTFGYGLEFADILDLNKVGGVSVKGLSIYENAGNKMPRIHETTAGMLNAIGLQNIGAESFLTDKLPKLRKYDTKIVVNFWGRSIQDYIDVAALLDKADVDMLEMNISCPNVKEGGISFSSSPEAAANVVSAVRKVVKNKPLMVKLSPNVTDIKAYAVACENAGADALSAINTLMGMAIDINTRKPYLANVTGGLSGPAIKPVGVRMVHDVYKSVKIPVMGMGGIMNFKDVVEYFLAGATACQIGTANFVNHTAMTDIADELDKYCIDNNIANISELTGGLII